MTIISLHSCANFSLAQPHSTVPLNAGVMTPLSPADVYENNSFLLDLQYFPIIQFLFLFSFRLVWKFSPTRASPNIYLFFRLHSYKILRDRRRQVLMLYLQNFIKCSEQFSDSW